MTEQEFLNRLKHQPSDIAFTETMEIIETNYQFHPVAFSVGTQKNAAGENQGSCKLLAFAKLNHLSEDQTLQLFGKYYREDVLQNPEGNDHQNIRNFILSGWKGVEFDGTALSKVDN